jgi:hypothetical protein
MEDEMGEACNTHGRESYKMLAGKREGMIALGILWRRWEDNK